VKETVAKINETINVIAPKLKYEIEVVEIYGKNIVIISVKPSNNAPHDVQGEYYTRKGHFSCLASVKQVEEIINVRVEKSENNVSILKEQNHQLLLQNSELAERFKKSQGRKSKLLDYVIGAAVGAAFSMALQLLF
jgi:predicted HTH transcriptional regulator